MKNSTNSIRPVSLLLAENSEGQLLVFRAEEQRTGKEFYRFLGGGIKFGEKSEVALKREIKEEINAEIGEVELLKVFENIFEYEDMDMHEIVFVSKAKFTDENFYKMNNIKILDSKPGRKAVWIDKAKLIKANFYPDGIKELIEEL